jgi:hypothetical protein
MRKEYNLNCCCGATAKLFVDFNTWNQGRVNNILSDLECDVNQWYKIHEGCTSNCDHDKKRNSEDI